MVYYVCLFILFLLCRYLGQILGLMIHCENCEDFSEVKKYVFIVPGVKIALLFPCVQDCFREKNMKPLLFYFFSGNMSLIILCVMVELLPEWKEKARRKKVRDIERQLNGSRISIGSTVRIVLYEAKKVLGYDTQYI